LQHFPDPMALCRPQFEIPLQIQSSMN
jgi:hypothetical protein